MQSIRNALPSPGTSLAFVAVVTAASGFVLGALTRPTWQASVESAQVLAGIVQYPLQNSLHIYHLKLWTIINQLSALALTLGTTERFLSIFISGVIAAISYLAVGLCTFAVSRNAFWATAAPFLVDFTIVRNVLAVNYPMEFMGTPHTYGVVGLAWCLLTLSVFALERYSMAGLLLGLAPAVHPSMGVWLWCIVLLISLWNGRDSLPMWRAIWKPTVGGLAISFASLGVQVVWMRPILPNVDASIQSRFISAWVDLFDIHRQPVSAGSPGVHIAMFALVFGLFIIQFINGDAATRWLLKAMAVASALAFFGAVVSRLPPSTVPQGLLMLMPTRLFLLSNIAFVAILFGLLGYFRSVWVRINSLLLALFLVGAGQDRVILYGLVSSGVAFAIWKSLSRSTNKTRFAEVSRWSTVLMGIALFGFAVRGIIGHAQTAAVYRESMDDWTNNPVLAAASATRGVLVIGTQSFWTQIRTRKPLLVEVTAMDQLPYAPESGPYMNEALKAVYGVDLLNPPEVLRRARYNEDLTPITKPLWERRSTEEWRRLGDTFGFTAILANAGWSLELPEVARDSQYVLYQIPMDLKP